MFLITLKRESNNSYATPFRLNDNVRGGCALNLGPSLFRNLQYFFSSFYIWDHLTKGKLGNIYTHTHEISSLIPSLLMC